MSLHFLCRACGTQHPSRLRIGKPHQLRLVMGAFGEVLEPCPLTGRWVAVRADDLNWSPDPEPVPILQAANAPRPPASLPT